MSGALRLEHLEQPTPAAAEAMHLRLGRRSARTEATIVSWSGGLGVVQVDDVKIASGAVIGLRYLDADGLAWQAQAVAGAADILRRRLAVRLTTPWTPTRARTSDRVQARSLILHGSYAGQQTELVAIDVSPSGCRVSGVGTPPLVDDHIRIAPAGVEAGRPLTARVVRIDRTAPGGFELALAFDLDSAAARAAAAWLVGAARRNGA